MSLYLVLRFLHLVTAIAFVGGLLARQVVRGLGNRTDDVRRFADLSAAAGRIENTMVIPGNLAVIVVGVVLALHTGAPILGFLQGAARNWLLASNVLLVLGLLAVPLVFVPRGKRFGSELERALSAGSFTPELRAALGDPVVRTVHTLELVLVFVIVYLMVFKPF
jgi:uncharacterized membrane protein